MDFEERLRLYTEGGMINDNDVKVVHEIIEMFEKEYGIVLTEENAGMFIAHLCAAFGRNVSKEKIPPVSKDMMQELVTLESYPKSLEILDRLRQITKGSLNSTEEEYALLHINNLLATVKVNQKKGDNYGN